MTLTPSVKAIEFDAERALSDIAQAEHATSSASPFGSIKKSQDEFSARHELERQAMLHVSALKRFAPLILSVIHRPGVNAEVVTQAQVLRELMDESFHLANDLVAKIADGDMDSAFIHDQAVSVVSEFVGTDWAFFGRKDVRGHVMTALDHLASMQDVVTRIGQTQWKPGGNQHATELRAGLTMSMIKSSEPLLSTLIDYGINDLVIFETLSDNLLDDAMNNLAKISEELPTSTRLLMVQNHLEVSGRIMKACLSSAILQQQPTSTEPLKLKPIYVDWKKGLQMLEVAVSSKIALIVDPSDPLSATTQKTPELQP